MNLKHVSANYRWWTSQCANNILLGVVCYELYYIIETSMHIQCNKVAR